MPPGAVHPNKIIAARADHSGENGYFEAIAKPD
jgi:hypothetical protein